MGSAEFFAKSCGNAAKLCQNFVDNPSDLVEEMKKISMDILGTGDIQIFDRVGDGHMGYQIYNVKEDPSNSDDLIYARVGRFNLKTGLDINPSSVVYPTKEDIISKCPNEQACQDCFPTDPSVAKLSEDTVDTIKLVLGVCVGILLIAVIVLIGLIVFFRRKCPKEDTYITPNEDIMRPTTYGMSESPYHSGDVIEETN